MAKNYLQFLRPKSGVSSWLYFVLNAALPILVLVFVRLDLASIAFTLVLLSKWRIFAMRPRYWLPNLRANSVDIFVGLSIVVFMSGTKILLVQLLWTIFFLVWLLWLKPKSSQIFVMIQALLAQIMALIAFYQASPDHAIATGVIAVWLISYLSARHFFGAFEEPYTIQLSAIWGWFAATLTWVLEHWVIIYVTVPQVALIITLVGYILALLYYLHSNEKLKNSVKHQLIGFITILLIIIIAFSDWQAKTI
ncbi:MAG TPA: hypothetical protein PLJ04_00690 [Candidatus Saccharibacteria bacterium]|nr:hypothetical protein [Candidatus Saccharibacteria bacterium]MCB9816916.1 hypothetical protein [Candidatus Nomurabacteria bacterium]HPD98669.1 hypothetical protein [Candidatus Saccharibacteria bacterium]HPR10076.1 hypothetical protein [Candidatus Saccharibacteria bacterium]